MQKYSNTEKNDNAFHEYSNAFLRLFHGIRHGKILFSCAKEVLYGRTRSLPRDVLAYTGDMNISYVMFVI